MEGSYSRPTSNEGPPSPNRHRSFTGDPSPTDIKTKGIGQKKLLQIGADSIEKPTYRRSKSYEKEYFPGAENLAKTTQKPLLQRANSTLWFSSNSSSNSSANTPTQSRSHWWEPKLKEPSNEIIRELQQKKWIFTKKDEDFQEWKKNFLSKLMENEKIFDSILHFISKHSDSFFSHTAIPSRLNEAILQADKKIQKFLENFRKYDPEKFLEKYKSLSVEMQSVMDVIIGNKEILQFLANPKEIASSIEKTIISDLQPVMEVQEWEKTLYYKLISCILHDPSEKTDEIVSKALTFAFQQTFIIKRFNVACLRLKKNHSFLSSFKDLEEPQKLLSLTTNTTKLPDRDFDMILEILSVPGREILRKSTDANLKKRLSDFVEEAKLNFSKFDQRKDKCAYLQEFAHSLFQKTQLFTFENEIVWKPTKIKDLITTFRAFCDKDGQKMVAECIQVSGKALEIQDLSHSQENEIVHNFLLTFVTELMKALKFDISECDTYVKYLEEAEKCKSDDDDIRYVSHIPILPVLYAISFNSFGTANTALRNLLFGFRDHIQFRYFPTSRTHFKIERPSENSFIATQIKTFVFYNGSNNSHTDYASLDVHWTIKGSLDLQKPSREGLVEFKNFKMQSDDEKVLKEVYAFLYLAREFTSKN